MLLSCQESFTKFAAFEDKRSPSALRVRAIICEQNKGLARKVAHRMAAQCNVPFEDLEQEALIGLLRSIDRFNPHAGVAFSSFAVPYIRGGILHYLRDYSTIVKISRRWREGTASVKKDWQVMQSEGSNITIDEVAQLRGIPRELWEEQKRATSKQHIKDIDKYQDRLIAESAEEEPIDLDMIHERLGRLDNPYRSCIAEHFIGQLSAQKIADRRNKEFKVSGSQYRVNEAQVMALIQQGIKKMREADHG